MKTRSSLNFCLSVSLTLALVSFAETVGSEVLASRGFFGATAATMLWNSAGTALLVQTQCDVDKSNRFVSDSFINEKEVCSVKKN